MEESFFTFCCLLFDSQKYLSTLIGNFVSKELVTAVECDTQVSGTVALTDLSNKFTGCYFFKQTTVEAQVFCVYRLEGKYIQLLPNAVIVSEFLRLSLREQGN